MNIVRSGIIINTEKYDACVSFYRDLFDLKCLFTEQYGDFRLTCFEFDGTGLCHIANIDRQRADERR